MENIKLYNRQLERLLQAGLLWSKRNAWSIPMHLNNRLKKVLFFTFIFKEISFPGNVQDIIFPEQ